MYDWQKKELKKLASQVGLKQSSHDHKVLFDNSNRVKAHSENTWGFDGKMRSGYDHIKHGLLNLKGKKK